MAGSFFVVCVYQMLTDRALGKAWESQAVAAGQLKARNELTAEQRVFEEDSTSQYLLV